MTPEPFTTVEHDISGMDGFMLDTQKLMASELWALATGDEFKAAIGLWCRAWAQKPAGSLPNDERILQAFSGAGPLWKKVREMALRGFVLCSDGRLYHRTLCDDVIRCAAAKKARHDRTKKATQSRQKATTDERNVQRDDKRDVPQEANVTPSHSIAGHSIAGQVSIGGVGNVRDELSELEAKLREAAGWQNEPHPNLHVTGPIHALIQAGCDLDLDVLPTVKALAPSCRSRTGWKYFLEAIARARDERLAAGNLKVVPIPTLGTANAKSKPRSIERSIDIVSSAIDAQLAAARAAESG